MSVIAMNASPAHDIDLSVLVDGREAAPPCPVGLLGSCAPWVFSAAEAACAPVDYVVGALLTAVSGAIGNARWVSGWPGWKEPPTLWVGNVGGPSLGKTPAAAAVLAALRRVEADEVRVFAPELQAYETRREIAQASEASWKESVKASIKNGEPPPFKPDVAIIPPPLQAPRIVVGDSTPEALGAILGGNPRGVLTTRDELSGLIGGMDRYNSGGERAFYLEAYCGGSYTIDRKASGPIAIEHLSIAIFGGMQPDRFSSLVGEGDDDGLAARFLWISPEPRRFSRPKQWADEAVVYEMFKRLRSLPMVKGEHGLQPVVIPLADAAAARLEEWCREDQDFDRDGSALYRSWRGKGRGHVLRLALVLEFLEWAFVGADQAPQTVSEKSVISAAAFYFDYFLPMARRTFGDATLGKYERDAGAVARHIISQQIDRLTLKDIYRSRIGGISKVEHAEQAVAVLVDAGWLEPAPTRHGETAGRRSKSYRINPELWEAISD